jgi:hypothetical protein
MYYGIKAHVIPGNCLSNNTKENKTRSDEYNGWEQAQEVSVSV